MLAHTDRNISVHGVRLTPKFVNRILLQNCVTSIGIAERKLGLPASNLMRPLGQIRNVFLSQSGIQGHESFFHIRMNRDVCFFVLVDFGWIDIDMHDLAVLCEFFQLAGYSVIKPHAECEQQV